MYRLKGEISEERCPYHNKELLTTSATTLRCPVCSYHKRLKFDIDDKTINLNLKNINAGKALTLPLAILDGKLKLLNYHQSLEYKESAKRHRKTETYKESMKKAYKKHRIKRLLGQKEWLKKHPDYIKEYNQRPEVKSRRRIYETSEKRVARRKAYNQSEKGKATRKRYIELKKRDKNGK